MLSFNTLFFGRLFIYGIMVWAFSMGLKKALKKD